MKIDDLIDWTEAEAGATCDREGCGQDLTQGKLVATVEGSVFCSELHAIDALYSRDRAPEPMSHRRTCDLVGELRVRLSDFIEAGVAGPGLVDDHVSELLDELQRRGTIQAREGLTMWKKVAELPRSKR